METIVRDNLRRIGSEIDNDKSEMFFSDKYNAFRITDIIRTSIFIEKIDYIDDVYNRIKKIDQITIVRINMCPHANHVKINYVFKNSIIGEIIIRIGSK